MIFHNFLGNESSNASECNSDESDLEALRKLSLPTNSDINSVADVIEQATRQSKNKVKFKHHVYLIWNQSYSIRIILFVIDHHGKQINVFYFSLSGYAFLEYPMLNYI